METAGNQSFENRGSRRRTLSIVLFCLLGIAFNATVYRSGLRYLFNGTNDFIGFYTEARLAGSPELYDRDAVARDEAQFGESPRFLAVIRLPFHSLLVVPLRWLPFGAAYRAWQLVSLAAVAVFVLAWPARRRTTTAVAVCWSLPLFNAFMTGQDGMVAMALLAVSVVLLRRQRPMAAGCVASLCFIKYHLFLPLPLLALARRWGRFGGGLAAGAAGLLAVSFAVAGLAWPLAYLRVLRLGTTTPRWSGMPNLHGLLWNVPHALVLEAVLSVVVLLATWYIMRRGDERQAVAAMLAGGLLLSYHAFLADAFLLVPVGLMFLDRAAEAGPSGGGLQRVTGLLILSPLSYLPFVVSFPIPPATLMLLPMVVLAIEQFRRPVRA